MEMPRRQISSRTQRLFELTKEEIEGREEMESGCLMGHALST